MRSVTEVVESGVVPDAALRWAIRRLHARRLEECAATCGGDASAGEDRWAERLRRSPIALVPELANEQHYEMPPDFFRLVLGPRMKYSACHFETGRESLGEAEEAMLAMTCERADVRDGMRILDLGCGWGSLTGWLLERYPRAEVVAVSNSAPQRAFIEAMLAQRGFDDRARIITCDVNSFEAPGRFDRVMSIEMMEHARNWEALLQRMRSWLAPGGAAFVHVFTHARHAYPFAADAGDDWMGRHFFSGGQMPSHGLMRKFDRDLVVEQDWRESGMGYRLTSESWLANLDAPGNRERALEVLARHQGREGAKVALQRWRMFFMACAELFGFAGGTEWGVSHYRLVPRSGRSDA